MDENKDFEQNVEETAEKAEEIIEAAEEAVEEAAQEIAETVEEIAEEATEIVEAAEEAAGDIVPPQKKKCPLCAIITAAVILVLAVFCTLLGLGKFPKIYNKYNHMGYVNITGKTIADIADEAGMDLSELLAQYNLPEDMPANTQESAAYYVMPVKTIAQMYGMSFDDMKELLGFGEDVTEDTEWGKAEGEVTLEKYIGEDNLASFKEKYGFGDEVTLETKWKEVRKTVDTATKAEYDKQKAETDEAFEEEAEETEELTEEAEEAEEAADAE